MVLVTGRRRGCSLNPSLGPVQIIQMLASDLGFLDKAVSSHLSAYFFFLKAFCFDIFSDIKKVKCRIQRIPRSP